MGLVLISAVSAKVFPDASVGSIPDRSEVALKSASSPFSRQRSSPPEFSTQTSRRLQFLVVRDPVRFLDSIFASLIVNSCVFAYLEVESLGGGAILCFSPLFVENCRFIHCSAGKFGGSIAAFCTLSVNFSAFEESVSLRAAAVMSESYSSESMDLNSSTIINCFAQLSDGIVSRKRDTNLQWKVINMTSCTGLGMYSGLIATAGTCQIQDLSLANCGNGDFGSGIALFATSVFDISFCTFRNLTRRVYFDIGGLIIHCDSSVVGRIEHCRFLKSEKQTTPSIYVGGGNVVSIISCCFAESEKVEKNQNQDLMKFYECGFDSKCGISLKRAQHRFAQVREFFGMWIFATMVGFIGASLLIVTMFIIWERRNDMRED
jgi:hypothetical protein